MVEAVEAVCFSLYLYISLLGLGNFVARRFFLKDAEIKNSIEYTIAFSTGFGIYALFYFFYYIFFHSPGIFFVLSVQTVGLILGAKYFAQYLKAAKKLIFTFSLKNKNAIWIVIFIIALLMVSVLFLLMSICPVKLGDAISGYLETARWIYHNGHNSYDPYNTKYSTMPVFTEIIYSLSFSLKSEIGVKIFDALCGFTMLLAIYSICSTYVNRTLALYSAVSFTFVEDFTFIFGGGKIDIPCQLIFFTSLIILLINIDKPIKAGNFLLSVFLFAFSIGQKYTIGIFIPFYGCLVIYILLKNKVPVSKMLGILGSMAIISLFIVSLHLIKDYIWCGNPFAPFNNPFFHSSIKISPHEYSKSTQMSPHDILFLPKTLFMDPKRLPFTLFIGIILYIFSWRHLKKWNPIFVFASIQLVIWISIFKSFWFNSRFLFGIIALFIFLVSLAFNRVYFKHKIIPALFYVFSLGILCYLVYDLKRFSHNIEFISGKLSRDAWEEKYNTRCVKIIKYVTPRLDQQNKMYCMGGVTFKIPYDKLPFTNTEQERVSFDSSLQNKEYLLSQGFKYILFRPSSGTVTDNETGEPSLNDERIPKWLSKSNIIFKHKDGLLYKID